MFLVHIFQVSIMVLSMLNYQALATNGFITGLAKVFQHLTLVNCTEQRTMKFFLNFFLRLQIIQSNHFMFFSQSRSSMRCYALRTQELHAFDTPRGCTISIVAICAKNWVGVALCNGQEVQHVVDEEVC